MMLDNIPEELKRLPNWLLWRNEYVDGDTTKKPTKVPYNPHNGHFASITNPATWGTMEQCLNVLPLTDMSGLGFVITPEAGVTCIDLDYTDDPAEQSRQFAIAQAFDSYSEVSPSQKGLHIWVKGSIPAGRRRGCVEMYSAGRYMTMTGQVHNPAPVRAHDDLLHQLWAELAPASAQIEDSGLDLDQCHTDEQIMDIAKGAINGEKFQDLWDGEWQRHYPSQSEADFALINILAYYTQNRVQITRMFRNSGLGRRKKALRADYCEKMIGRAFDNQPAVVDISALKSSLQQAFAEKIQPTVVRELPPPAPEEIAVAQELKKLSPEVYTPPAGLVGELAGFIYSAAPRPVPEIALAAAIGLMAGVCGRSYNISGTGLNQYTLLIAKTGRGKEGMGNGISKLIGSIMPSVPQASLFNGPAKIASQEALLKHLSKTSKSFVSTMGEFADTLQRMSNDSHNPAQQGVKQSMLDLYNKSGKGCILGNMIYSDTAKNTETLTAPSFSLLGEATPEKFYELLTEGMIAEGFLPRFTIIEYLGNRPQLNKAHQHAEVPERLKERFGQLCAYSLQMNNSDNVIKIQASDEAQHCFDEFDRCCDGHINGGTAAAQELWNRAHIKSLKLGGLLAIGTNYINPCVSVDQARWAIRLIVSDIENLLQRFDNGDVGAPQNQNRQLDDLKKAFTWYLRKPWSEIEKYPGATLNSYNAKVVPHSFLTAVCRARASFKQDRIGPVQALKTLLMSLLESGEIQELAVSDKVKVGIGKNGKVYVILDQKSFL